MSTIVTQEELVRRRKLRNARVAKAEKLGIALGWVTESLEVMKQANGQDPPQLPKRSKDAA